LDHCPTRLLQQRVQIVNSFWSRPRGSTFFSQYFVHSKLHPKNFTSGCT
jgi:hypothetical protein